MLNSGLLKKLISIFKSANDKLKKEITWIFANVTCGGTPDQIKRLVQEGCLEVLVSQLSSRNLNIHKITLEAFDNILKVFSLEDLNKESPVELDIDFSK